MKTYTVASDALHTAPHVVPVWNDSTVNTKHYSIKELPTDDQPREKLKKHGPQVLSLKELVAVLLSHGTKKEDVLSMADRVIREYGERALMSQKNPQVLARELAIPENKALQMVACAEIGRRLFEQKQSGGLTVIRNAQDVFDYLVDLRELPKEHLRGLYLNVRNQIIHDEVLSIGTTSESLVHPRDVLRPAIEYGAAALVLAHNHPSGDMTPSEADMLVTQQIKEAATLVGIELLDHVIITKERFHSISIS